MKEDETTDVSELQERDKKARINNPWREAREEKESQITEKEGTERGASKPGARRTFTFT